MISPQEEKKTETVKDMPCADILKTASSILPLFLAYEYIPAGNKSHSQLVTRSVIHGHSPVAQFIFSINLVVFTN